MINADRKRRRAIIESVRAGLDDRGIITSWINLKFDTGNQSFGGIVLDEITVERWKSELASTFDVVRFENLEGLQCYALWSLGDMNESIQGLESMIGNRKRFTSSSFVRRHYPDNFKKPLTNKVNSLRSDIRWALGRAHAAQTELDTIESNFTDWDVEP